MFDIQKVPVDEKETERFHEIAKSRLEEYKMEARLVVTSRLHCASPCMEMGIPGQYDHEDIKLSFEKVIQACNKNNIIPGMGGVYTEELMYEYINLGMRFILCGSDLSFLMTAAKNRSDNLLNFYKNKGK